MQSTYSWFVPNYPPPFILNRELIINEGLKRFEQRKNDQQWLENWIKIKKSSKYISISDYRQKLIIHAQLLRQYQNALNQSSFELLNELKEKILENNLFIYESNRIKILEKKLHQRKSKRARLRRQKQIKSIEINDNIIEQSSITNKKLEDIRSLIHLIEQLQNIQQSNSHHSLIELHQRCRDKLFEYENEMKMSKQDLCNYLFNNQNQSFYSSTNSDGQHLLRAHQNQTNLIEIRQQWDEYITTQQSSFDYILPFKWHEPQSPCDYHWSKYIFK